MALLKKTTSQLQTQENDIHTALKAWYLIPGIQRDLRNKENAAVQTVLALGSRSGMGNPLAFRRRLQEAEVPATPTSKRSERLGRVRRQLTV